MKRMMLIVNPNAGRSGYRYYFGDAMKVLADGGYQISLFFTTRPGEATEFAAYYAKDYDTVACIGGDGTLSEVISGLMKVQGPPPIGYFPMGTTNDIASSLGLLHQSGPEWQFFLLQRLSSVFRKEGRWPWRAGSSGREVHWPP